MNLVEINSKDDLDQAIAKYGQKMILLFTSPTCPPCRMLEPVMDNLANKGIVNVAKVNVLENQELAAMARISATPTSVIFENNQVKDVVVGYKPEEEWTKLFK